MNSAEVLAFIPLSLYRNEVILEKKQNTTPCWRKKITVGAILDQQMGEGGGQVIHSWCVWASWRRCWAIGERGRNTWENKSSTHPNIRLKVRIRFICICATVIKKAQ